MKDLKNKASGILPIAASNKLICLAWRSPDIIAGDRWGIIGGMCKDDPNLTDLDSAVIELGEEVGYRGPLKAVPAYIQRYGHFSYQTFVGIVPEPFSFNPDPEHAWETSFIDWLPYKVILNMMVIAPETFHNGVIAVFQKSRLLIESIVNEA